MSNLRKILAEEGLNRAASYDEPPSSWVEFAVGNRTKSVRMAVTVFTTKGPAFPGEVYQDRVMGPAFFEFGLEDSPERVANSLRDMASMISQAEVKYGSSGVKVDVDIV